jgi:hypothetical protein
MKADERSRRFWARVDHTHDLGCWPWTGRLLRSGYAQIKVEGRNLMAHRFAYEDAVGPIPEGMTLDHLCRVRSCCRPSHLEPVTPRENTLRGESMAAIHARRDCCVNGHMYMPENTLTYPGRPRVCRECKNERNRQTRLRKKGQA